MFLHHLARLCFFSFFPGNLILFCLNPSSFLLLGFNLCCLKFYSPSLLLLLLFLFKFFNFSSFFFHSKLFLSFCLHFNLLLLHFKFSSFNLLLFFYFFLLLEFLFCHFGAFLLLFYILWRRFLSDPLLRLVLLGFLYLLNQLIKLFCQNFKINHNFEHKIRIRLFYIFGKA